MRDIKTISDANDVLEDSMSKVGQTLCLTRTEKGFMASANDAVGEGETPFMAIINLTRKIEHPGVADMLDDLL